jgi:hypothetical protein
LKPSPESKEERKEKKLRKLMMLAAMLALALAVAIPALAQTSLEVENEGESDDVSLSFGVSNEGDYAMQCTPALQFGQTGNLNNAPAFLQYASEADDFEAGGIEFAIEPTVATDCEQAVQQSSAASS